ncbi:MAG: arginine N-succinyltransferase [Opitutaceae bacterium]|nr:arginine N-succinyltransferase [Opitutaceae bacterium]
MYVLRPIREDDLPRFVALVKSIDGSLTSLPADEETLTEHLEESQRAFSPKVKKPGGEHYLFVLEDTASGELVGTSGILARVGGFEPWYSYEIRREPFVHKPLRIEKEIPVLHLKETHRGPTEVCSLYLRAEARRGGLGRLLSLGRFMFIGTFPRRFAETLIAEMRGYIDQQGKSPFWEAVGRHFFEHDLNAADQLSGLGDKSFIAALVPRHPIYIPLLPPEVQAVIGRVHHDTEPALALLKAESFVSMGDVDIFDAGVHMCATTKDVRTIRQMRTGDISELIDSAPPDITHLLGNGRLDFRACLGTVAEDDARCGGVRLAREAAEALQLRVGDKISYAPLR